MKTVYRVLTAAAIAAVSAGCAKEIADNQQIQSQEKVAMTFVSNAVSTRTSLADDQTTVVWTAGDRIGIFDDAQGNNPFDIAGIDGSSATFEGEAVPSGTYYGLYPYSETASVSGQVITTELPSEQTAIPGTFAQNVNLSAAVSDGENELDFQNVCGLVTVEISSVPEGLTLKSVTLSGLNGEKIAGKVNINMAEGTLAAEAADAETSASVTLAAADGTALEAGKYVFAIIPADFTQGLKVGLNYDEGTSEILLKGQVTVAAGHHRVLPPVESATIGKVKTISTPEGLKAFAEAADSYDADDVVTIDADLDMAGVDIAPFKLNCTLDGRNHKIYNIALGTSLVSILNEGAVLKNVVFGSSDGTSYDGTSELTIDGNPGSLGVVGVNHGTVETVTTFVNIDAVINNSTDRVGGVVGTNHGIIKGCTNHGDINVTGKAVNKPWIGGIVGRMESGCIGVENCINTGDITVDNSMVQTASGIAGILQGGNITGCDNSGNITVKSSELWSYFSGIVSFVQIYADTPTEVSDCHNTGNFEVSGAGARGLGGIAAFMHASSGQPLFISDCTNKGSLTVTGLYNTSKTPLGVGGIFGFSDYIQSVKNEIRNCDNTGDILLEEVVFTNEYLNNLPSAGGILGRATASMEISGCTNGGDVKSAVPAGHLGGIAGLAGNNISVSGNENSGAVTLDLSTGTYDLGSTQIGVAGLVGVVTGSGSTVSGNTNSGNVTVTAAGSGTIEADGVVAIPGSAAVSADNVNTGTVTE